MSARRWAALAAVGMMLVSVRRRASGACSIASTFLLRLEGDSRGIRRNAIGRR